MFSNFLPYSTTKNISILLLCIFFSTASFAQSAKQVAVEHKVEQLKKAMIDADSTALDHLTAPELSYGHSGGTIENKQEFIAKIVSGKSDFVTMDLSGQTIIISGKTALVRHKLHASINDNNKPGEINLLVLLVWQKQHGDWKLLARQAVKQPLNQ